MSGKDVKKYKHKEEEKIQQQKLRQKISINMTFKCLKINLDWKVRSRNSFPQAKRVRKERVCSENSDTSNYFGIKLTRLIQKHNGYGIIIA